MISETGKKLTLVDRVGNKFDHVILQPKGKVVESQEGCFFPEGYYAMNMLEVERLAKLKAKSKYNGRVFRIDSEDYPPIQTRTVSEGYQFIKKLKSFFS